MATTRKHLNMFERVRDLNNKDYLFHHKIIRDYKFYVSFLTRLILKDKTFLLYYNEVFDIFFETEGIIL